jgi:hypothetical protein
MQFTAYSMSVPAFARSLKNLSAIIDKAVEHCRARKIDERVMLEARLFPDMFSFTRQIQLASDFARAAVRLSGKEPSKMEDTESSFAALKHRITRTIQEIEQISEADLANAAGQRITRTVGGKPTEFDGYTYLALYMQPHFYFHVTTAYNILRHNGVEIGKRDYIGAF